jgi:hypothetical protein
VKGSLSVNKRPDCSLGNRSKEAGNLLNGVLRQLGLVVEDGSSDVTCGEVQNAIEKRAETG